VRSHQNAPPPSALVDQFAAALAALGGHAHLAPAIADAIDHVAALFDRYGTMDFISWDDREIPCPGLLDALTSRGRRRVTYDVPFDQEGRASVLAGLEPIGVGLTGAFAAVAASGTVLLASGAGRGRLASLLPPVHIAVIRARDLYPTLETAMKAHPSVVAEASNVVCITGPSRTADIEMTLTHGVHGPKHLHVVILTEGAS
jgi:L-lactate dehydrogenase complex protein LldG